VWREPIAVARSLQTRDQIPLADGLALWEHYNRSAVTGLQGVDTYILDYASVLDDAGAALSKVAAWLGGLDQFAASAVSWDVDRAVASIDQGLRHESAEADEATLGLFSDQRPLAEWLGVNTGPHTPLEESAPVALSPWPEAVLANRRAVAAIRREMTEVEATMEALVHSHEIQLATVRGDEEAARSELANVRSEEAAVRSELAIVRSEEAAVRSELANVRAELEGTRCDLAKTLNSTSWKVTKPFRAVSEWARKAPRS
jgi:hypothetical protein